MSLLSSSGYAVLDDDTYYLTSSPGLRVCVYPTPRRQALSTLVCERKDKQAQTDRR